MVFKVVKVFGVMMRLSLLCTNVRNGGSGLFHRVAVILAVSRG